MFGGLRRRLGGLFPTGQGEIAREADQPGELELESDLPTPHESRDEHGASQFEFDLGDNTPGCIRRGGRCWRR